mgnify:CR=1 FL=1
MQYKPDEDKQYEKWGVDPPKRAPHGTEQDLQEQFAPAKSHRWKQIGRHLVCDICPMEHGSDFDFTKYILVGTDDSGKPILKKIV